MLLRLLYRQTSPDGYFFWRSWKLTVVHQTNLLFKVSLYMLGYCIHRPTLVSYPGLPLPSPDITRDFFFLPHHIRKGRGRAGYEATNWPLKLTFVWAVFWSGASSHQSQIIAPKQHLNIAQSTFHKVWRWGKWITVQNWLQLSGFMQERVTS